MVAALLDNLLGAAPLRVVWVHNDAVIRDCAEFAYVDHGQGRFGLRIADAFAEDSGIYICEVYNRHGDAESWCYLTVADTSKCTNEGTARNAASGIKDAVTTSSGLASHNVATAASGTDEQNDDGARVREDAPARRSYPIAVARPSVQQVSTVQLTSDGSVEQELRSALSSLDMTRATAVQAVRPAAACQEDAVLSSAQDNFNGEDFDDARIVFEDNYPHQVPAQVVKGPVSVSTLLGSTVVLEAVAIGRPEPCIRWLKGVN